MSFRNKLVRITMICYMPIVIAFALIRMLSAFGLLNFLGSTADYVSYSCNSSWFIVSAFNIFV